MWKNNFYLPIFVEIKLGNFFVGFDCSVINFVKISVQAGARGHQSTDVLGSESLLRGGGGPCAGPRNQVGAGHQFPHLGL